MVNLLNTTKSILIEKDVSSWVIKAEKVKRKIKKSPKEDMESKFRCLAK